MQEETFSAVYLKRLIDMRLKQLEKIRDRTSKETFINLGLIFWCLLLIVICDYKGFYLFACAFAGGCIAFMYKMSVWNSRNNVVLHRIRYLIDLHYQLTLFNDIVPDHLREECEELQVLLTDAINIYEGRG